MRELLGDASERPRGRRARSFGARDCATEPGRDELLDERRLPPGRGEERPQVTRVDPEAREPGARRRDVGLALAVETLAASTRDWTTPYSSSSFTKSSGTPARSPSSAPSISASRSVSPTVRFRARSAAGPGPSSASRSRAAAGTRRAAAAGSWSGARCPPARTVGIPPECGSA